MSNPSVETEARLDAMLRDFEALSQQQVGYPANQGL